MENLGVTLPKLKQQQSEDDCRATPDRIMRAVLKARGVVDYEPPPPPQPQGVRPTVEQFLKAVAKAKGEIV